MFTINNNIIEFYGNHDRIFIACCKQLVHILHGITNFMLSGDTFIIIVLSLVSLTHSITLLFQLNGHILRFVSFRWLNLIENVVILHSRVVLFPFNSIV